MVEMNIISGVYNNIIGTYNVKLSKEFNVDNFILISSDKAVRPTNVMGATKRLSEMAVQAYADYEEIFAFSASSFNLSAV